MTDTITIVGAGMAGLLAANMLGPTASVLEAQPQLPNNHSAVLRFRSTQVADAVGVNFRKVSVIKANHVWLNPVADALNYSFKNLGKRLSDRSINAGTEAVERYIAPPDFISHMASKAALNLGVYCGFEGDGPYISTIPMPVLMRVLEYPHRNARHFTYRSAVNIKARLRDTDAFVSLLVPDPSTHLTRISITGDEIVFELPGFEFEEGQGGQCNEIARTLAKHYLGIPEQDVYDAQVHRSTYAKIMPVDDEFRHDFMHWASVNRNIYSLGRFATWRPGLLLDDLVPDIRKIGRWIRSSSGYEARKDT